MNESFKCPECGSTESNESVLVETDFSKDDPWSGVLQRRRCAKCGFVIPAHLAELWAGISHEQAAEEWRKCYRDSAPKHAAG